MRRLALALVVATLLVAGCGGDSSKQAAGGTGGAQPVTGLTPADAKTTCERIQKNETHCFPDSELARCEACFEKCADCSLLESCPVGFACP
jgi:hypothetical protein